MLLNFANVCNFALIGLENRLLPLVGPSETMNDIIGGHSMMFSHSLIPRCLNFSEIQINEMRNCVKRKNMTERVVQTCAVRLRSTPGSRTFPPGHIPFSSSSCESENSNGLKTPALGHSPKQFSRTFSPPKIESPGHFPHPSLLDFCGGKSFC